MGGKMRYLICTILEALAKAITSSTTPLLDIFTILNVIATSVIALLVFFQNKRFDEENKKHQLLIHNREVVVARDNKIYNIFSKITEVYSYFAIHRVLFYLKVGSTIETKEHMSKIEQFHEELYNIQDLSELLFGGVDNEALSTVDRICNQFRKIFSDYEEYYIDKMQKNSQKAYELTRKIYKDIPERDTPDFAALNACEGALQTYINLCSSNEIETLDEEFRKVRSAIIGMKSDCSIIDVFSKYFQLPVINQCESNTRK